MADGRPTIYKHASRSMINIVGPSLCCRDEEKETNRENEVEVVPRTTGLAGLAARLPPSPGNALEAPSPVPHPPLQKALVGDTPGTLHRRRSLPTFSAGSPPPPYPSFAPIKAYIYPRINRHLISMPRISLKDEKHCRNIRIPSICAQ